MTDPRPKLAHKLAAMIERARSNRTPYFCESCAAFARKRPCRHRHRCRYWTLAQLERIHEKLRAHRSLDVKEMIFLELIERMD